MTEIKDKVLEEMKINGAFLDYPNENFKLSHVKQAIELAEKLARADKSIDKRDNLQEVSDYQVDKLFEWILDKNRKSADLAFTSGRIRNIAREFENERKRFR